MSSVFISYSHNDRHWKERLLKHLAVIEDEVSAWSDEQIDAGEDWPSAIADAIAEASVAVLLVSADFLGSRFILDYEIPMLLRRRDGGALRIYPIVVRPCAWQQVRWLASMEIRPKGPPKARPLSTSDGDHQWEVTLTDIVTEIRSLLGHSGGRPGWQDAERTDKAIRAVDLSFGVNGLAIVERFIRVPKVPFSPSHYRDLLVQEAVMPDTQADATADVAARGATRREVEELVHGLRRRYGVPFRLLTAREWVHVISGGGGSFPPLATLSPLPPGSVSRRSRANAFGVHLTPPRLFELVGPRLPELWGPVWALAAAAVPGHEPEQISLDPDESDPAVVFRLAVEEGIDMESLRPSWTEE